MKVKKKIRSFYDSVQIAGDRDRTKKRKEREINAKLTVCAAVGIAAVILLVKEFSDSINEDES